MEMEVAITVVLPPLAHGGAFVKGVAVTKHAETLVRRFPHMSELFHVLPPTDLAAHSLSEADFFNEQAFAPGGAAKNIDIACMATTRPEDNLPTLVEALHILRLRHPERPLRAVCVSGDNPHAIHTLLGSSADVLRFLPAGPNVLPTLRAAKVFAHAGPSGKHGHVLEAMSCDVPVASLSAPIARAAGAVAATPDAEGLAQAIWHTLVNRRAFQPRTTVLLHSGRQHTLNTLIDAIPYYAAHLPGYEKGAHAYNRWIDAALTGLYASHLYTFLFHHAPPGIAFRGEEAIGMMLQAQKSCA